MKVINLSSCNHVTTVPHLSIFASLESLQVDNCRSLCRLDGLEQLVSLNYLSTSGCEALETTRSVKIREVTDIKRLELQEPNFDSRPRQIGVLGIFEHEPLLFI